ncbi:MAG: protein kinase [Planctomycetaceae bacterium]|nr:protein kinase [Planctomycetaceae bacterium]
MTAEQFGRAVVGAGLLSAEVLKAAWAEIAQTGKPADGEAFARRLVERGELTDFQAKQLLANRGHTLVLGDYVVLAEIGAGGMGQVYKAQHRRMNRVVALKVMSPAAMKDEAAVKRFQREVRAAARLDHPNIVTAYDSGEAGNVKYLVMQFVDGGDLSALIKQSGPLPIAQAVDYVVQAARGLGFAHAEGVVHRDIKPANLLLDPKCVVKILDMGLARIEQSDDGLTATEQVMGTVDYMSPEQAANTKGVDARADVYSLGCTFWFLLTGKKLYEADTMIARLMAHREAPLPSLVKERDDAPWALEQVLHRMIAKRPEDRFDSMDDVVAALEPFAEGKTSAAAASGARRSAQAPELAAFLKGFGSGGSASKTSGLSGATAKGATSTGAAAAASPQPGDSALVATRSKRRLPWLLGAAVAAAIVCVAAYVGFVNSPSGGGPDSASSNATASSTPSVAAETVSSPHVTVPSPAELLESRNYVWSRAENLGAPVNDNRSQQLPTLTADELSLICMSQPAGGPASELVEFRRATIDSPWEGPVRLTGAVGEREPALSPDGLQLAYVASSGSLGKNDIWLRRRPSRTMPWSAPENLGSQVNGGDDERYPQFSPDGLSLIFASDRPRGHGGLDLYVVRRKSVDAPFGSAAFYDPRLNTSAWESNPLFLTDGDEIVFARGDAHWMSYTAESGVRGAIPLDGAPPKEAWLSRDGRRWYFTSSQPGGRGGSDVWMTRRVSKAEAERLAAGGGTALASIDFGNPASSVSPAVAPGDYALAFDGLQSRVTVPGWKYRGEHPLTVECWIVWKRSEHGSPLGFLCGDAQGAGFGISENSTGKAELPDNVWNFAVNDGQYHNIRLEVPPPRGVPVHVAAVFDGKNEIRFYIDGKLRGRAAIPNEYRPSAVPFTIGANPGDGDTFSEYFRGVVDEFRISQTVRYDADFTPPARYESDPQTIALYHFDDGTGDRLTDSSGRGHHGQIVSSMWVPGVDAAYRKRPLNPIVELPVGWTAYDVLTSDEWTWSTPENLGPVVNFSIPDMGPSLSADGLTMIFGSARVAGFGGRDLHIARRANLSEPWSSPVNMGPHASSRVDDIYAYIFRDGLTLMKLRGDPPSVGSIWLLRRSAMTEPWGEEQALFNAPGERYGRFVISADETTMLLARAFAGSAVGQEIMRYVRKSSDAPWEFVAVEPEVNSPFDENALSLLDDERVLLLTSNRPLGGRPQNSFNLWLAVRKNKTEPWSTPQPLPASINQGASYVLGTLRFDGCELIYSAAGIGADDLFVSRRVRK